MWRHIGLRIRLGWEPHLPLRSCHSVGGFQVAQSVFPLVLGHDLVEHLGVFVAVFRRHLAQFRVLGNKRMPNLVDVDKVAGLAHALPFGCSVLDAHAESLLKHLVESFARVFIQYVEVTVAIKFDRNGYFNVLYEDPSKAFDQMFEQRFGMSVKDAATEWQSMREASDFINVNKVGHALIAKHPELRQVTPEDSNENAKMLDKIMAENKWEYTLGNLEAAYAVATTQGKMRLPAKPNTEADVPPHPPATLTGHSGGGEPADEKELLRTMSTDQVREYYINKHKNAQRST